MSLIVNKFGGGIINGSLPIKHLSEILKKDNGFSINVFSAMGKTTNNLENLVEACLKGDNSAKEKIFNDLYAFHINIASELFPEGHLVFGAISDIFKKIDSTLSHTEYFANPVFFNDQVVPFGEKLTTVIIGHYLDYIGIPNKIIDATLFLETDATFGSALVDKKNTAENLDQEITPEILEANKNIITEGFIGFCNYKLDGNESKYTTTLGREGSDYTAGILGNLLDARKVILWKDVPGVMERNPKLAGNENVKKIDALSYEQMEDLLRNSATGLVHPKTLNEVKEKRIPLQVRPFWDLNSEGTIIN